MVLIYPENYIVEYSYVFYGIIKTSQSIARSTGKNERYIHCFLTNAIRIFRFTNLVGFLFSVTFDMAVRDLKKILHFYI